MQDDLKIFRGKTKRKYKLSMTPNEIWQDQPDLSWKSRGILGYLLSLPDTWEINQQDVINRGKDGRDSVASGFNELIEAGYLHRAKTIKMINGKKIPGVEYYLYDHRAKQNNKDISTENGKSVTENPLRKIRNGKPVTINTELTNTNLTNTNTTNTEKNGDDNDENMYDVLFSWGYMQPKDKRYNKAKYISYMQNHLSKFPPETIDRAFETAANTPDVNNRAGFFYKLLNNPNMLPPKHYQVTLKEQAQGNTDKEIIAKISSLFNYPTQSPASTQRASLLMRIVPLIAASKKGARAYAEELSIKELKELDNPSEAEQQKIMELSFEQSMASVEEVERTATLLLHNIDLGVLTLQLEKGIEETKYSPALQKYYKNYSTEQILNMILGELQKHKQSSLKTAGEPAMINSKLAAVLDNLFGNKRG